MLRKMKTLDEVARILTESKSLLRKRFKVERIGLFGTCVRDKLKFPIIESL